MSKGQNDLAVVAVAVQVTIDNEDVCRAASVVLGGVAATPVHAVETEKFLVGRRLDDRVVEEGAQKAAAGLSPPSDVRASAEYRSEMVKSLTRRAVRLSASRTHGGA